MKCEELSGASLTGGLNQGRAGDFMLPLVGKRWRFQAKNETCLERDLLTRFGDEEHMQRGFDHDLNFKDIDVPEATLTYLNDGKTMDEMEMKHS